MGLYQLISPSDAAAVLNTTSNVEWSQGRARTKALEGTVKQNQEVLSAPVLSEIGNRLMKNAGIQLNHIPFRVHSPKFSRYCVGDRYHLHTDAPWMGETRTDLSCTIWLSDPDSYQGGWLKVGGKSYKGQPGQVLVYECGTPHEVTPVTNGERVCVVTWMQSRIRDAAKRKIVSDFRKFLSKLEVDQQELFLEGGAIHSSIIRMWME